MATIHMAIPLPPPSLRARHFSKSPGEEKAGAGTGTGTGTGTGPGPALRFSPPPAQDQSRASCTNRQACHARNRKKKKGFIDLFDYGEDPDMTGGEMYSEGLQEPEEPRFPVDPNSEYGFLDFPQRYNVEMASLPLMVRDDVRKCCCLVAGGVYENLLFFPVIQLLMDRYPGVKIDVVANGRGKQTYEINKNVKRAWVYNVDAQFVEPRDYLELVGKLKNEYYDMIVSTRLSGLGHAITLFITNTRQRIAYAYPNVNAAGAGQLLTEAIEAPSLNLADGGYHIRQWCYQEGFHVGTLEMVLGFDQSAPWHATSRYADLIEVLKNPKKGVPLMNVRPLQVGISSRLKDFVQQKYMQEDVVKGEFLVFHGIESTSKASMQSRGDSDSLLPLQVWAELAQAASSQVVIVIPYEPDRRRVLEIIGEKVKVVFISTPGQLAAIINDSVGVVTTNTAAVQLACALKKPSVALFSSTEKASLFVPDSEEKRCTLVASRTGKLADIDVKLAISAMKSVESEVLIAA